MKRISELGTILAVTVLLNSIFQLLVTANVIPSSLILFTLTMKAIRSSQTLIQTTATQLHITEGSILQVAQCYFCDTNYKYFVSLADEVATTKASTERYVPLTF
jgi:hypothetical protein